MSRGIQTGMVYFSLRIQPATAVIPYAQMLEQNDAIDFICMVDWLSSAWPQHVWPEDSLFATPGVGDSWHDTNVLLGMAAEAAPNLGLLNGTGCLRTGPAEHMRSFMTLASATNAEFIAAVGVGEACSTVPFGYNRSQGLAHLEDSFKLFNKLWECDGPFDFDGKVRKYQQAYIGTTRTHRPTILALGGGPRLLNIAAQYADGWCTWLPHIGKDPAIFAEWVQKLRNELENCGRDPESFRLASYFQVALHEDEDVIEHAFDADWAESSSLERTVASTVLRGAARGLNLPSRTTGAIQLSIFLTSPPRRKRRNSSAVSLLRWSRRRTIMALPHR